jgi:nicotinamide mononucleotide transporter
MFIIEAIAVLFGLICVYYSSTKNILSWPTGIISTIAYAYLFYKLSLYADFTMQFIFIGQGLYGWYNWIKNKDKFTHELIIEKLSLFEIFKYCIIMIVFYIILVFLLIKFTNSNLPYIDSFVTVISLTANWLSAKRKIDNWVFWMVANVVYIYLFSWKGLYMSVGLYTLFIVLDIYGIKNWKKGLPKNIYLAGPDVFRKNAKEHIDNLIKICEKYRFIGISPFDNNTDIDIELFSSGHSKLIFNNNLKKIKKSDYIVANLDFFRGAVVDDGTAVEIGLGFSKNKKIYGYTKHYNKTLEEMTNIMFDINKQSEYPIIEKFSNNSHNIMIIESIKTSGGKILPTFEDVIIEIKKSLK